MYQYFGKPLIAGGFLGVVMLAAQLALFESPLPMLLTTHFLPLNSSNLHWLWLTLFFEFCSALALSVVPILLFFRRRTADLRMMQRLIVVLGALLVYVPSSHKLIFYSGSKAIEFLFFLSLNVAQIVTFGLAIMLLAGMRNKSGDRPRFSGVSA